MTTPTSRRAGGEAGAPPARFPPLPVERPRRPRGRGEGPAVNDAAAGELFG